MLSICPHLIPDYFEKVKDIVRVYRPQIVEQVVYSSISAGLVSRGVYSQGQHDQIQVLPINRDQMTNALDLIQQRLWGLENFIMVLMDENINPWLTEELFQTYSQYLVQHIKKQKSNRKCECVLESQYIGVLNKRWMDVLKTMDSWILKLGTTLGFLSENKLSASKPYPWNSMTASSIDEFPSVTIKDITDSGEKHILDGPIAEIVKPHLGSGNASQAQDSQITGNHIPDKRLSGLRNSETHSIKLPTFPKCTESTSSSKSCEASTQLLSISSEQEGALIATTKPIETSFDSKYFKESLIVENVENEVQNQCLGLELLKTDTIGTKPVEIEKRDVGLQYDGEDIESSCGSSYGFDIEDEIAALDISRISFLSLDLDWDLEDDEAVDFDEGTIDVQSEKKICSSCNSVNMGTQTLTSSTEITQDKDKSTVSESQ